MRTLVYVVAAGALATLALALFSDQLPPVLLYNPSPSEPEGFYWRTLEGPGVGKLIAFKVPAHGLKYARDHIDYVTRKNGSILKGVAAGPGDNVCARGGVLSINNQAAGIIAEQDRHGAALPKWNGCRRLGAGEWWVLSDRIPNSFDSRYFGPVPSANILGVYKPLWVRS
jgi:conjugative transfer signal peptidase TraF